MTQTLKKRTKESKANLRRLILDMYETHPPAVIAELAGRSVHYVHNVASAMGIRSGGRGHDFADLWTPEEEKQLAQTWGRLTVAETARHFGRTTKAIMQKAHRLKLGRVRTRLWTPEDDATLRAEYATGDLTQLAIKLRRTVYALRHRAKSLGIQRDKSLHPWRNEPPWEKQAG